VPPELVGLQSLDFEGLNKIKVEVCDQAAVIEQQEAVLFVWKPLWLDHPSRLCTVAELLELEHRILQHLEQSH